MLWSFLFGCKKGRDECKRVEESLESQRSISGHNHLTWPLISHREMLTMLLGCKNQAKKRLIQWNASLKNLLKVTSYYHPVLPSKANSWIFTAFARSEIISTAAIHITKEWEGQVGEHACTKSSSAWAQESAKSLLSPFNTPQRLSSKIAKSTLDATETL